jgi:hypothetical protein
MRVAIKKLDVADIGNLQALVIENIQGIEPGLTVLDSRLLLGHATIDLVAMDANASLALVTLGFSADEEMLLKAVEAYSWSLEYPEAIRRLYPAAQISESRPPRMIFVVGRVPDAFHRKVKQLGFPEVDCVEFRHLEVDGTPILYFETLVQLRRPLMGAVDVRATASERMPQGAANGHVHAPRGARMAEPAREVLVAPIQALAAERPAPVVEAPQAVASVPVAASMIEPQAPVLPQAEPMARRDEVALPVVNSALEPLAALLEQMALTAPSSPMIEPLPVADPEVPVVTMPTLEIPELVLESRPAEPAPAPEPAAVLFAEAAKELLGAKSIEEAARAAFAAATPSFADRQPAAPQPAAPAPPVPPVSAAEKSQAEAEAAKQAAPLPQEFAGLNFPNDGVLTRQWMEFLNRMANSK